MDKQKNYETYLKSTHRLGRIVSMITLVLLVGAPFMIGTLLGASKVNIATMQVSRNQQNGVAMMFLTVDSEVGKETLKLLQGLDGITKVQLIKI